MYSSILRVRVLLSVREENWACQSMDPGNIDGESGGQEIANCFKVVYW